jgi:predicted RNase H-like HicB family nuclease
MKLKRGEYVLERNANGGYLAYFSRNKLCCGYGDTPEKALKRLQNYMDDYVNGMYLVEEFVWY